LEIVHHHDERGVWATKGRRILFRPPDGSWSEIARFPRRVLKDLPIGVRLASRLLRLGKCNVYPTRSGRLLGIRGGVVYRFDGDEPVALFGIRGDCVMNRAIAETRDGSLFFGEYFTNPTLRRVRIHRVSPELDGHEVVYTFDSPRVYHVHAIHTDPHEPGRLWIPTGDFPGQCYLVEADESFETVQFRGDGSQLWRMVGVLFQRDRICWITDSHLETNRVVTMDRASGELTVHGERDASTWYAAETSDGVYLGTTTVEPGAGIATDQSRIIVSRDGVSWQAVAGFEKDSWPMRGFGFGALHLPSGRYSSSSFWVTGEGVKGFDGTSRHCSLETSAA